MRYIAAYLLLQIGGKAAPTAEDIKSVLGSVGIDADEERLSKLLSELNGKDVAELISEGSAKFASVPSGGAAASSAPAAAAGGAAEAPKEEEKKEEEKVRISSSSFDVPPLIWTLCSLFPTFYRRNPTTTWASVSSTKRLTQLLNIFKRNLFAGFYRYDLV